MDLYVVKDQHGHYLVGKSTFRTDFSAHSIFSLRTAKSKTTYLLKRFSKYGIIPEIFKVVCSEDPKPVVKFNITCEVCGQVDDYTTNIIVDVVSGHWGGTYTQQKIVAICNECKQIINIGEK